MAVECLENGNYHVYRKVFPAKQRFFLKKLQESGNELNKIKEN